MDENILVTTTCKPRKKSKDYGDHFLEMIVEKNSDAHADMTEAEFRAALDRVGDWVASYRCRAGAMPVLSQAIPGTVEKALPFEAPL